MLKTNSKQARQNIRAYVLDNYDTTNYEELSDNATFCEAAYNILKVFRDQEYNDSNQRAYHKTEQNAFIYWCSGLPSILNTCYYYNRSALQDLGEILQETEEERNRYTETAAEELLTYLIYRELLQGEEEHEKNNQPKYYKAWNGCGYPLISCVVDPLNKQVGLFAACTEPHAVYKKASRKKILETVSDLLQNGYTLSNNTSYIF